MGTAQLVFAGDRTIAHDRSDVTGSHVTFPPVFSRTIFPVLFSPYFFFSYFFFSYFFPYFIFTVLFFRSFSRTILPYFFTRRDV